MKYKVNNLIIDCDSMKQAIKIAKMMDSKPVKLKDEKIVANIYNRSGKLLETKRFSNIDQLGDYIDRLENFYGITEEQNSHKTNKGNLGGEKVCKIIVDDSIKDDNTEISRWVKKIGNKPVISGIVKYRNKFTFLSEFPKEDRDFDALDEAEAYAKRLGYTKDSSTKDAYQIEELAEGEKSSDYDKVLKKYNLRIENIGNNKVKIVGNKSDIIKYFDKEIGIDESSLNIKDSKVKDSYLIQSKYNSENYWQTDGHFSSNKQAAQKFNSYEEAAKKADDLYSNWEKHVNIVQDSIKDNIDYSYLTKEEQKAVEDYKNAISETTNPEVLKVFEHILNEELNHIEELKNAENMEEVNDSVKDSLTIGEIKKIVEPYNNSFIAHDNKNGYYISSSNAHEIAEIARKLGLEHKYSYEADGYFLDINKIID